MIRSVVNGRTYYRGTPPADLLGERLRGELVTAGLPPGTAVYLDGPELVVLTGDDPDDDTATVDAAVAAHQGNTDPAEVADRQLAIAARAAFVRLVAGDPVDGPMLRPILRLLWRRSMPD
jgi:hypothetical protein